MLMLKRIKVALYERALVYRDRNLERVLAPGKYWLVGRGLDVQVYDVSSPELELPRADVLVAEARDLLDPYVQIVELGDREVGLVYKNERLTGVLSPGTRRLYWRGPVKVRVDVRDIRTSTRWMRTPRACSRVRSARPRSAARWVSRKCRTRPWVC
jgi:hypothetical protein